MIARNPLVVSHKAMMIKVKAVEGLRERWRRLLNCHYFVA